MGTEGLNAGGPSLLGPKSITFHDDTAYVLFEGDATNASMIAGWTLSESGGALAATPIAGSILPLSSTTQSVDPAQIEFTPDGAWLVVTEKQSGSAGAVKGSGSIDTFGIGAGGVARRRILRAGERWRGRGLADDALWFRVPRKLRHHLGSRLHWGVGSYSYAGGVIAPVAGTQFLPTDPAPCWVAVAANRAYVTNAKGPSVSGFTVDGTTGGLTNIGPVAKAIVASTGRTVENDGGITFQGPTDEFVSIDGQFLYVLNAAVPSIGIFQIQSNGTLARVGTTDYTPSQSSALPTGSAGIVAR